MHLETDNVLPMPKPDRRHVLASGDRLLNRKQAAKYIGFTPETLAVWACTKRYDLKPIKIGRSVRYLLSELDAFLYERMTP